VNNKSHKLLLLLRKNSA